MHFARSEFAWTAIGAFQDLFLTCMVWFILDLDGSVSVIKIGTYTYVTVDVIK